MTLKLHWSPDSANLPVRMTLEMFDLPFDALRVNRASGEHFSDGFRAKNPQGLIPVLEDGDRVLFETGAILWYLAEKIGRLGPNGPKFCDEDARATVLKWMFYLSNTVHADLRMAFYTDRYIDNAATALLREGISRRMVAHFDLIETSFFDGADEHPMSLPDIYLSVLVRWAQLYPIGHSIIPEISRWPIIEAMCARIEAHPASIRAFLAESIPTNRALTKPQPPNLPIGEITGA